MPARDRSRIEPLLLDLARNYRWGWHRPTRILMDQVRRIARVDPAVHPLRALEGLDESAWATLLADPGRVDAIEAAHSSLTAALADAPPRVTAYFSPEFGINETLPQYSGGLGILAGDHLKAASDANLPLVGIGLFYREGFFRQVVTDGRQTERDGHYTNFAGVVTGFARCFAKKPGVADAQSLFEAVFSASAHLAGAR